MEVRPSEGLYYYDFMLGIKCKEMQAKEQEQQRAMIVATIEEIQRNLTQKEVKAAYKARCHYVNARRPSQKVFEEMIKKGKIRNSPVMLQDYQNVIKMY